MFAFRIGAIWWLMMSLWTSLAAQNPYPPINEHLFINTSWRYTYTTHAESNTVIHRADESYKYFIYFNFDYTYKRYTNGEYFEGDWALNEAHNELTYTYRNINQWRIAEFSLTTLTLEYTMYGRSSYRYHFVAVNEDETPFERPANLLPNVDVLSQSQKERQYRYRDIKGRPGKRFALFPKRRAKRRAKRNQPPPVNMRIEMVGGGFFGGVDPVYRNHLTIDTEGQVVHEIQTLHRGTTTYTNKISREDLENLVAFIENKDFFEMEQTYSCQDARCRDRLRDKPRPISMRIAVTHGHLRKLIVVRIWEGDGRQNTYVNYPKNLNLIVDAILRASQLQEN